MTGLHFREVWCLDFEFFAPDGARPTVLCMVAKEYHSGATIRQWLDGSPTHAPFACGRDVLFVAYFASAEMGCFLSLGWPMPDNLLDLYAEFKWLTCGRDGATPRPRLIDALNWFGLPSLDAVTKFDMRQLAMRGGHYSDVERQALLDYCESDVDALVRLLPSMAPKLDLPRALLRGRFVKAVAKIEHNGIPIDVRTLALLDEHWEGLRDEMIRDVDQSYGVYDGPHFRQERFGHWLAENNIPWPRRDSGDLVLNDDVFKNMVECYPRLQPLRQLRQMLDALRLADLPVGPDGRNRCLMSPFGTITGRCAPSTSRFIFGRAAWMRSLIQPTPGRALAYIDWSSQEYGIGAALSNDTAMIADYEAGDPYLGFAKRIGMVPLSATKHSHRAERDVIKAVILGTQYGMGEQTLAVRINKPVAYARDLLRAHRQTYRRFWDWSDAAVSVALFQGRLWTRYGWQVWTRSDPNPRSLANFPCQGNGAEMLRLAAIGICDASVMLDATVHDAVLIEAETENIDHSVSLTKKAMERASELVLSGFRLRTEAEIIVAPDRYRDERGVAFFDKLCQRLQARLSPTKATARIDQPVRV